MAQMSTPPDTKPPLEDGFLVPSWYVPMDISDLDFHIASVIWGFSLGCGMFTMTKAINQTYKSYKRGKVFNAYIIMIWGEWFVSIVISILVWCFLNPDTYIDPSFWFYFWILVLWVIQIQCIIHILINRIRLLMVDQQKGRNMHWSAGFILTIVNISVFIIWIPARLQISDEWISINNYWDRIEKVIIGIIDIGLNSYFIYLVRTKLIDNGLVKYESLFRFNVAMAIFSMLLDVLLVAAMSLQNNAVYLQFHPLVYLIKLHIEMNIAELITKIVRSVNHVQEYGNSRYQRDTMHSQAQSMRPIRGERRSSTFASAKRRMDSIDIALGVGEMEEAHDSGILNPSQNGSEKFIITDTTLQDSFGKSPSIDDGEMRVVRRGSASSNLSVPGEYRRSTSVDLRDLIEEEGETETPQPPGLQPPPQAANSADSPGMQERKGPRPKPDAAAGSGALPPAPSFNSMLSRRITEQFSIDWDSEMEMEAMRRARASRVPGSVPQGDWTD